MVAARVPFRVDETFDQVMAQMHLNADDFVWEPFQSPAELGRNRMNAMRQFSSDFPQGKIQSQCSSLLQSATPRYVAQVTTRFSAVANAVSTPQQRGMIHRGMAK